MNLDEAILVLEADNSDCILMRVSGSVKIKRLAEDAQGKLNGMQRDELLDFAVDQAINFVRGIEASK